MTSYMKMTFDSDKVYQECQKKNFAIIYIDEIEKIMQYRNTDGDKYMNAPVLLSVFIFFRIVIFRRPNKLRHEERNIDGCDIKEHDIAKRREISPEAYNDKFIHIAELIDIPPRTLAKATNTLEELGLITVDRSYNVRIANNEFRTFDLIFANAYKREGSYLLDDSPEYSRREIRSKEKLIQKYKSNFAININKRRQKGGM